MCWVVVSVRGLSLVAASGGHSSPRCVGLSLSRPLLLRSTGSRCTGSVIVAHGPSCSAACGVFPDQGSNPCPLHWQADSQPLRHQGSLWIHVNNKYFWSHPYLRQNYVSCMQKVYFISSRHDFICYWYSLGGEKKIIWLLFCARYLYTANSAPLCWGRNGGSLLLDKQTVVIFFWSQTWNKLKCVSFASAKLEPVES